MRFYGEYCFLDVIPLDKVKPEHGSYEEVSDHGISYAFYVTPYEEDCQRHHDAPDWGLNLIPREIIGPWDKGEEEGTDEQKE